MQYMITKNILKKKLKKKKLYSQDLNLAAKVWSNGTTPLGYFVVSVKDTSHSFLTV